MIRTVAFRVSAALLAIAVVLRIFAQTATTSRADSFIGTKAGDERSIDMVKFCWAPPGRFLMGSPSDAPYRREDEAPVEVTLSRGFWIGKYEVTQGQWKSIAGEFPRAMDKGQGADFPVYWVSYLAAEGFCRKLTDRARASGELPANWEFRMPTEAQWEYACRAGTRGATSFGDQMRSTQANFNGRSLDDTEAGEYRNQATKVGSFPANPWGLHDMHGNVWEWCRDWYHWNLPGGVDPDNSAVKGMMNRDGTYSRVRRGGAWIESATDCRSARRLKFEPERSSDHIGFRVVVVRN